MGKTPKLKGATKPSLNSRASRKRGASPSLDLDKSLTSLPRPAKSTSFLAPQPNAGITKSRKKTAKQLTRKQKVRAELGKDRAEDVREKLGVKVGKSEGRAGTKRGRRAKWEELNEKIEKEMVGSKGKVDETGKGKGEKMVDGGDDGWSDDEDGKMESVDVGSGGGVEATMGGTDAIGDEGVEDIEEVL